MKTHSLYLKSLIILSFLLLFHQMDSGAEDLNLLQALSSTEQDTYLQELPFLQDRLSDQKQMNFSHRKMPKDFVILRSRKAGMFAVLLDVLCLCKNYEGGAHIGFEINFAESGLYYHQEHGPDWWSYYFEPLICQREKENEKPTRHIYRAYPNSHTIIEQETKRDEAHELIQKYIHIKQDLQDEVDEFVERHFSSHYVISIHYRGTDKIIQAPKVEFEKVKESLLEVMSGLENENIKIFIASDEESFIAFMRNCFGDLICYNENVIRSEDNQPIHIKNRSPYQSGRDALIDCLLLARGSFLIRTSSNLSLCSTFFNPHIPVLELSQRW